MREVSPFILCGGVGTRLWPLSREAFPKQFHKIVGPESLFQHTCRRITGDLFGDPIILSNHQHRFLISEQLEDISIKPARIVLEPVSRNTAPAASIAALIASRIDPDSLVLLVPSDHMIADATAFARAVEIGVASAKEGALVTFGVEPDCPHIGYGYIETEKYNSLDLRVKRFVEKPSRQAAEVFIDSGSFYWNSGIFLFRAAMLLELLELHAPEVLAASQASLEDAREDFGFLRLSSAYENAPAISLDYAIAEQADNIRCVPLDTSWSDVGSWAAVWSLLEKDGADNVVFGEGEVLLEQTNRSLASLTSPIHCSADQEPS